MLNSDVSRFATPKLLNNEIKHLAILLFKSTKSLYTDAKYQEEKMKRTLILSALITGMLLQFMQTAVAEQVQVKITTSLGVIELELDRDKAPISVANFLHYAREGKYNGTIFHRVISNFMIQGGGFDKDMHKKATFTTIANEADNGLFNSIGSVAMARTSDPHSASSQFFINTNTNIFLNHRSKSLSGWGYAVFGRVSKGMSVVRRIEAVSTGNRNGMQNVPLEAVMIERVEVIGTKQMSVFDQSR